MTGRSWRDRGIYLILLGLALVVVVQATLLPRIRFLGAQPDLLLVLVVCWSLLYGVTEGLVFAFLAGLAIDVVAGLPLGTSPLALMPLCFLAVIGRNSVYVNNIWLPVLLVAVATPLEGWLMLFMRQLHGVPVDWAGATTRVLLPALALNFLLTIIVVWLMRRLRVRARLEAVA
jgi:rod shape-determining protein MreD